MKNFNLYQTKPVSQTIYKAGRDLEKKKRLVFLRITLFIIFLMLNGISKLHAQDAAKGKDLFMANNCGTCHKIDEQMVGPALGPMVTMGHKEDYLIKWIQNNQALIAKKNPEALEIYNKFNQQTMPVFSNLTDQDAKDIIGYVRSAYKTVQASNAQQKNTVGVNSAWGPNGLLIWILFATVVIALVIILVLNKIIKRLENVLTRKQNAPNKKSFSKKRR
ncbi:MAG: cytochrome c [Bacteroidota bacterium]